MGITINWNVVITIASLATAIITLTKYFTQMVHFVDKQKEQEAEITKIKEEQAIVIYGVLACLKGLSEQGCDGPVHEAIDKIEKHLNKTAHA